MVRKTPILMEIEMSSSSTSCDRDSDWNRPPESNALISFTPSPAPSNNVPENTSTVPAVDGRGTNRTDENAAVDERQDQIVNSFEDGTSVIIPERPVLAGLDAKYDPDPTLVELSSLGLSPDKYHQIVSDINDSLRQNRPSAVDVACLATGMAMIPLAVWALRHASRERKKKNILTLHMDEFNAQGLGWVLRWNRRTVVGGEPHLTIEKALKEFGDFGVC